MPPTYIILSLKQHIDMGVIHPKAYQGQMQKVGIWPNYTEGALLLTQMQEEIFLGDSPDGSVLNLQSSNVLMNPSPKTGPCLIYSDNPLRRQRYLAFLFARHFKHPTLNWPLNPEGSCFSAEKISHFEIWIMCLKSPGFRQVHDWGRWRADERRIEGSLQNLRQRGGNEKQHRGKTIAYDCSLPSVYKKYKKFDLFPWNVLPQGQGFITNDVLKDILREIDNTLTEDDLDHIIEEVDEDGSGTMDFDEFQEMMMG